MLVQFGLQATALRFGELRRGSSPCSPPSCSSCSSSSVFWFRYRLTWMEWLGAVVIVAGLGGDFLAAQPAGGTALPSNHAWLEASLVL